ncbi:MAG: FAD-containing oxidoreductase [Caulobacterales bacterium]|nr:FAD-containing oxidoreductase [Caulobacterales bacterium]
MTEAFDAIIIGAGQAGPFLAERLTQAGQSVAIIERDRFGGTCVNTGCMPTKTLVASARAAHVVRHADRWGVRTPAMSVDMVAVKARADKVIHDARTGLETWLGGMPGCTVIQGHARFTAPRTVAVGDRVLEGGRIFINVGGRAAVPDMRGVDAVPVLTNASILKLDRVPRHLVVIGGSYVGLEFAQIYRRFGAEVTVVEKGERLIAREDPEVSRAVREILEGEGIVVRTRAECIRFRPRGDEIEVGVSCVDGEPAVVGSHALLAVGRRLNTDDLGLETAGVEMDERGAIVVDDMLRTTAEGVWALGECNGRGAFTHTAFNDFEIVAVNLLEGGAGRVSDRVPAYALYIDPPLGRAGLTETEARAAGKRIRTGLRPMTRVSRAVERGETTGFLKVVVDADTDQVLGAAILGVEGDEAIHAIIEGMSLGATASTMKSIMHVHPTVSELIPTVFGELGDAVGATRPPP